MKKSPKPLSLAVGSALTLALAACGGGSSSDETPPPAPDTKVTLTGTVMIDQAIRNAVVCLDLNANGTCDTSEPASARTGADGAYTLTYDTAQVSTAQASAASLIASMVPGAPADLSTTIDAADTTEGNTLKPFVLKQVPGKAGQINPLTTLATAGISAGMTEALARSNTALQLAIAEGKIDNYQDDPASGAVLVDNARTMAKVIAAALEEGATLVVGDQREAVSAAVGDLASLVFVDKDNYSYRTIDTLAKASGTPGVLFKDVRTGMTAGTATPKNSLYNQAYLAPTGWQRCDDTVSMPGTTGSPSRSVFCGASTQIGFTKRGEIAGLSMTAVLTELQADASSNSINNGTSTTALFSALGAATFPENSRLHTRQNVALDQPIFIANIANDARNTPQKKLEEVVAERPASAVNLATGAGSISLGISSDALHSLRVAFTGTTSATEGTVQFYDCDLNSAQTVVSNCVAKEVGKYAISTVNGSRVLRFSGHAPTSMNHTRLLAEVANAPTVASGSTIYVARENKTDIVHNVTTTRRLNTTAWSAMRTPLGL